MTALPLAEMSLPELELRELRGVLGIVCALLVEQYRRGSLEPAQIERLLALVLEYAKQPDEELLGAGR